MDIEDKLHRKNTKLAKEEEDKKKEESDRFMKYLDIICVYVFFDSYYCNIVGMAFREYKMNFYETLKRMFIGKGESSFLLGNHHYIEFIIHVYDKKNMSNYGDFEFCLYGLSADRFVEVLKKSGVSVKYPNGNKAYDIYKTDDFLREMRKIFGYKISGRKKLNDIISFLFLSEGILYDKKIRKILLLRSIEIEVVYE